MEIVRDCRVLAKWKYLDRVCLLLDDRDQGVPIGVYQPTGDEDLELLPQSALAAGVATARAALQAARRVIETGKDERHAMRRALEGCGVEIELDAFSDQSSAHANALAGFESAYGTRYPITENFTKVGRR